ncbi:hypothetical protein DFH08DRAFT_979723 [Mycena albidolilacea]|uniref:RING-type domain-containing protein n=1 Tax=Mycena albidolilacea TaxID=1033008 RepID=A0AAD6YW77_9AGAR|nr:hypothetical protein DFH08DRAFT_979723 [Mycena albidolilacea]
MNCLGECSSSHWCPNHPLRVYGRPPSHIGHTSPHPPLLPTSPRRLIPARSIRRDGASRASTSTRAARDLANRTPRDYDIKMTPPRRDTRPQRARPSGSSVNDRSGGGYRIPRREPLTEAVLYNDAARPPVLATPKPHHVCSICWDVKSHPVSYLCGHSHCFVCIRLWLEKDWACPDCKQIMFKAPFRHYGEEKSIEYDYPFWVDDSRVSYTFSGLVFPPSPVEVILLDIESSP